MSLMATLVKRVTVMPAYKATLLMLLLAVNGVLLAADSDVPETGFLEYLGLWEESDEDWILLSEEISTQVAADATRTDLEPEGDESAEKDDES